MSFREENYENAVMILLDELGYTRLYGPDIERDFRNPLYMDALTERLPHINPKADRQAVEEALYKLSHIEHGSLVQQNKRFMDWLQNGMEVSYQKNGKTKHEIIRLIDYQNLNNNAFHAINQWTVVENEQKRPDVVVFVNGLPLVVVELKSCMREQTDFSHGYRQIKNYMHEIPSLFIYNAFCVISDLVDSKVGTITAGFDRFVDWKTVDGGYEETQYACYDVLFNGMMEQSRLLDIVKHFILFSQDTPEDKKILAGYHQYYAVKKAVESTKDTICTDGRGGVFWHTQGSGKSLSMVFYAALLQEALDSPTIVVITDRNDLDDQLYAQFSACKDFLRQTPVQATCRKLSDEYKEALVKGEIRKQTEIGLKDYLQGRQANGIIFTTMQKFEESAEPLSERHNIVVIADEAHRSQYGLTERVKKDGTVVVGNARVIRESLQGATFIGLPAHRCLPKTATHAKCLATT